VVHTAAGDYAAAVSRLQVFAAKVASVQGAAPRGMDDSRRHSQDPAAVKDWICAYDQFKPCAPAIELPDEIEPPDEGLLTDFEELPDSP